jgi:hypothetical protein
MARTARRERGPMSTPPVIRPALAGIGRRVVLARAALGLGQWLAPALGAVLSACVLDNLVHLPAALRLVALLAAAALVVAGFVARVWRPVRSQSPERTAVLVEEVAGIRDNRIINACQFESLAAAGALGEIELGFARATLSGGHTLLAVVPWARLLRLRVVAGWLLLLAGGAAALGAYAAVFPDHARNALARLALPLADLPPLGAVTLTVAPAGDVRVYDGETLEVRVTAELADHARGALPEAPVLVRAEGLGALEESLDAGERVALAPLDAGHQRFSAAFANLHRSFSFRVACGGSWSRAVAVTVLPLPALRSARFVVDGPAYTGQHAQERPGPPATLAVLAGSTVSVVVAVDQPVPALVWQVAGRQVALRAGADGWSGAVAVGAAGPYALAIPAAGGAPERVIARGSIQLDHDRAPQVELVTGDRNRFVNPDQHVDLEVAASDDLGLAALTVTARESAEQGAGAGWQVKAWRYLGPPGNPGPLRERVGIDIDARFVPGKAYLIEAVARDFSPPSGQEARSTPVVLRVRALADLALPAGDPLTAAFNLLKDAIAAEQRARGVTGNVIVNLEDIRKHRALERHAKAIAAAQDQARAAARHALEAFAAAKDASSVVVLQALVEGAMPDVRAEAEALTLEGKLPDQLAHVAIRQDDIIQRMIALLGALAERAREKGQAKGAGEKTAALDGAREKLKDAVGDLGDDLARFIKEQTRILERSKTLADKGPADLTDAEDKILGELAKEEAAWAKFMEEKLTDFSKLPTQDFADARQAQEFNEVWQDIKAAAAALGAKKTELAVPGEQAGLELATKLENNLERWMAEASDTTKWSMEEPKAPADVPLAELPKELEDIIGDLLDKEKEMTDDVQDVSSSWNDSIDKGAGWGSGDGPINNMSAKGITGNSLPNNNEVGGRSGEGRNGRSNGQMVEDTAKGKGGQETPTRLSPSPFEQGSVKDEDKKGNGGATGGGKNAGFASEGLRGPTPPPQMQQAMARLAGKQAQLRQQAGDLALKLRAQHLPSGDLESAVQSMQQVEDAARNWKGGQIKARYSQALDALGEAKQAVSGESRLQRERSKLPERIRQQAMSGAGDAVPPGYEDMVGRYFQALAGARAEEPGK